MRKIYSVAWGWTPVPEDMPSGDSLIRIADNIKAAGFDGADFLSTYESLDTFFDDKNCELLKKHCEEIGLGIGGFVFQSDVWNEPNPEIKRRQLDYFRKCALAAVRLGAGTISCIIPRPYGAKPTLAVSPSEKLTANLPDDYCWSKDWDNFALSLTEAADIAAGYGLCVALECFPKSLCSTPHAMLEICRQVNRPNFGIQLDTAHLINQRIDPETAVYMLGGELIKNVHFKDSDGVSRENLPAGSGITDYTAVLRALKNVGYKGNISIEVEFTSKPARYMKQALDHVRMCDEGVY